jgi:DNA gyrase/topoisomerase IV subunit B
VQDGPFIVRGGLLGDRLRRLVGQRRVCVGFFAAGGERQRERRGKQQRVAYSDEERDAISRELRGDNPDAKVDISRFKGLGEMDAEQLWETTLDPKRRLLKRIEIEDGRMASDITELLMGNDVPPRKTFIYEHATDATVDA